MYVYGGSYTPAGYRTQLFRVDRREGRAVMPHCHLLPLHRTSGSRALQTRMGRVENLENESTGGPRAGGPRRAHGDAGLPGAERHDGGGPAAAAGPAASPHGRARVLRVLTKETDGARPFVLWWTHEMLWVTGLL